MSKKYLMTGIAGAVAVVAISAPAGIAGTSPEDSFCYMVDGQGQFTDLGWMCGEVEEELAATESSAPGARGTGFADAYINGISGNLGESLLIAMINDGSLNPVEDAVKYCERRAVGLSDDEMFAITAEVLVDGSGDPVVEDAIITHTAAMSVLAPEYFCPEFL